MPKIYNCYTNLNKFGGAELIALTLTKELKIPNYSSELLLFSSDKINENYDLKELKCNTLSPRNFFSLRKEDIVFSHHRKCTTILMFLQLVFNHKFIIIHVAHNEFYSLKRITIFPNRIIAVSERVKENLINYFRIESNRISVVHNGIKDCFVNYEQKKSNDIKILYPARITEIKQQTEIVKHLTNNIPAHITIYFAGEGDKVEELCSLIKYKNQFKFLGYINIQEHIENYDYVMLCSLVEGLPTVLLEACMNSKPIICNNVGGNIEILENGKNGFLANNYSELIDVLKVLPDNTSEDYLNMSKYSRKVFENKFTLDKMIQGYKKYVYDI
jgi:glycosyltransferase involved in cell wall biosynthesis